MVKLSDMFCARKRLWQQAREITQLRDELTTLRAQNDSMREGMRRCVTCDYRIDFKQRQDALCQTEPATKDSPSTP
jgi:hypothetical protein|tara:strand:+ start:6056 stop:6283 length:228 start_codon:yes stop_codon:yes gene_type:complete